MMTDIGLFLFESSQTPPTKKKNSKNNKKNVKKQFSTRLEENYIYTYQSIFLKVIQKIYKYNNQRTPFNIFKMHNLTELDQNSTKKLLAVILQQLATESPPRLPPPYHSSSFPIPTYTYYLLILNQPSLNYTVLTNVRFIPHLLLSFFFFVISCWIYFPLQEKNCVCL